MPDRRARAGGVRPAGGARERRDRGGGRRAPLRRRRAGRATWSTSRSRPGVGGGVVLDGRLFRGRDRQRRRARPRHRRLARPRLPRLRPPRLPRGVRVRDVDRGARARGAGWRSRRRPTSRPPRARATRRAGASGTRRARRSPAASTSIVNLFEPELVVIGGGVSRAGEQLLGPVRERVRDAGDRAGGQRGRGRAAALGDPSASSAPRRSCTSGSAGAVTMADSAADALAEHLGARRRASSAAAAASTQVAQR